MRTCLTKLRPEANGCTALAKRLYALDRHFPTERLFRVTTPRDRFALNQLPPRIAFEKSGQRLDMSRSRVQPLFPICPTTTRFRLVQLDTTPDAE